MIAIVDYGAGNLRSVANALESLGAQPRIAETPAQLEGATAIVLPGVGSFGEGMAALRRRGFVAALHEQVVQRRTPLLGICLGMQLLAMEGHEHGTHAGLGWIPGHVERLQPEGVRFRVPHIGWNDVALRRPSPLFEGLEHPVCYFVHSFHFAVAPEEAETITATCWHGMTVTAGVQRGHIFGVQFHPEKSQQHGLAVLQNFLRWRPC